MSSRAKFIAECKKYNIELRDMTPISTRLQVVGTEIDLRKNAWRLNREWVKRTVTRWEEIDVKRVVSAYRLWGIAGNAVWGAYAGGRPMCHFLDAVRYACQQGNAALMAGDANRLVTLPMEVRDQLRSVMTDIAINQWRTYAKPPTLDNAVVTDASTIGFGAVFKSRLGVTASSATIPKRLCDAHINVLETEAVLRAVREVSPGSYWIITDNTTVYYNLRSGLGARSLLPSMSRLFKTMAERRVCLFPL
jgi:hypothetical protein